MSGKNGRFSILGMMALITVVAIDSWLIRVSWDTAYLAGVLMTFPMLNIMVLSLPKLRRDHRNRQFWVGFDGTGMVLTALIYLFACYQLEILGGPINWLLEKGWLSQTNSPEQLAITCTSIVIIYNLPQLLLASIAGWFCERYRVVVVRRAEARQSSEPTAA
jgi:amino acid transporter